MPAAPNPAAPDSANFNPDPARATKPGLIHIVILGGGYAGLTAAQRLSRQAASISLIDAQPAFSERIRLHQVASGQAGHSFSYTHFLTPLGVNFIQAKVIRLDPKSQTIGMQQPDGSAYDLHYDYLIFALGSTMDVNVVPGVREHAHAFHSQDAAQAVFRALEQAPTSRVLVVGGGLTGIETAAELAESLPQLQVTLAIDQPFNERAEAGGFHPKATRYLYQALARRKITLRTGSRVKQVRAGVAVTVDGQEIGFDTCIWTSGFVPPSLARQAGLQVNSRGQILTDAALRSLSYPNIIAVGDAAQASPHSSGYCRMGSATSLAMGTAGARTVVALLAGKVPPAFRFVYLFRNICLGRHDGVVQFVDRHDVPRSVIWTGSSAAVWKEYVCQSTLSTIGLTPPNKVPALPPLRMLPQLLRGLQQYA